MATKPKWPKEVDIVTEQDICKGMRHDGAGRHCLQGLLDNNFGKCFKLNGTRSMAVYNEIRQKAVDAIYCEIQAERQESADCIVSFNDKDVTPKSLIAKVWNRAMYRLGYTVGNPKSCR